MEEQIAKTAYTLRTYQPGDEIGLAALFNLCFSQNGSAFIRTPESVLWRYVHHPNWEPEQIQIAVNPENQIIGSVYATLENYSIDAPRQIIGAINDVAVDPAYQRNGVAKALMDRALSYFKRKEIKFAILTAAPKGHAQNKIYRPLGWRDLEQEFVHFCLFTSLTLRVPPLIGLFPFLKAIFFVRKLVYNQFHRTLRKENICDIAVRITPYNRQKNDQLIKNLLKYTNQELQENYWGKNYFSTAEWENFRGSPNNLASTPTFVAILKNQEIIACASYFKQDLKLKRPRRILTMGVVREFLVSSSKLAQLGLNYPKIRKFLRLALEIEMMKEGCHTLLFSLAQSDTTLRKYFRKLGYGNFKASMVMINSLSPPPPDFTKNQKPFKLSAGEAFLFP